MRRRGRSGPRGQLSEAEQLETGTFRILAVRRRWRSERVKAATTRRLAPGRSTGNREQLDREHGRRVRVAGPSSRAACSSAAVSAACPSAQGAPIGRLSRRRQRPPGRHPYALATGVVPSRRSGRPRCRVVAPEGRAASASRRRGWCHPRPIPWRTWIAPGALAHRWAGAALAGADDRLGSAALRRLGRPLASRRPCRRRE